MSNNKTTSFFKKNLNSALPMVKEFSEIAMVAIIGSIPIIGSALVVDRKTLTRLTAIFESDDEIHRDIDQVIKNLSETEEIVTRLKLHITSRKEDLQQTLDDYNRFKELAGVEKEKAQPILKELRHEGNKGVLLGFLTNLAMVILGIVISHYLRIWFPNFQF